VTEQNIGAVLKFEGIDPVKAREAQQRLDELNEKQLMDKGEFERLLKKRADEFELSEKALKEQLEKATSHLTKFKLTDKVRASAIEIELKEDKQGVGLTKRRKKRGAAQAMVALLNQLAHNVLVWAWRWLSELAPQFSQYGMLRMVRDLLHVSGMVEVNEKRNSVKRIVFNGAAPLVRGFLAALRQLLSPQKVVLILREI
jgi:hypothetical protein